MRSTPKLGWALPHAWFIAVLLALWSYWVWPDVSVPLSPYSDGLYFWGLIKTIFTSGSWLHANGLGAPFVATTYDFPYSDSLLFLIIGLIHLFTDDAGIGWNVFYLVGLLATYATAFAVLRRRLGHDVVAAIGAFVFAMLPYHFYRAPHLLLAAYFIVPLVVDVALDLAETERQDRTRLGRWIASHKVAIAVSIAGATCGVYYAFFSCIAYLFSGVVGWSRTRNAAAAQRSAVLVLLAGATVMFNAAPSIHFWEQHGRNPVVAARNPNESEVYGLNLSMLLVPTNEHRVGLLDQWQAQVRKANIFKNEASFTSLGLLPSVGFLILLCTSLRLLRKSRLQDKLTPVAALNLVLVLYSVFGGFGFLFAVFVSPEVRALNRVSVFLGFLSVYALALFAKSTLESCPFTIAWKRTASVMAIIAITVLVVVDQVPKQFPFRPTQILSNLSATKRFVQRIETSLPADSAVLTLPYVPYPEVHANAQEGDYGMLRPYVYSHGIRWSYGAMKGRPEDSWLRSLSKRPLSEQVRIARVAGFSGVYVERRGFADHGAQVERDLRSILGTPLTSDDNQMAFYRLASLPEADTAESLPALFGEGFFETERNETSTWNWAQGDTYLALFNPSHTTRSYRVSFDLMTETARHVSVMQQGRPGAPLWSGNLVPRDGAHLELDVHLAPGWNRFAFVTDAPAASPSPRDHRLLTYGVRNLAYVPTS